MNPCNMENGSGTVAEVTRWKKHINIHLASPSLRGLVKKRLPRPRRYE